MRKFMFSQREPFMQRGTSALSGFGAGSSREYYLHKRNGIFYVEYINPENGKKLTARSTGKRDEIEAHVQAKQWIASGIPTGRKSQPRPLEEAAGIDNVIKVIRKTDLNTDDALRVVETLMSMGLIDIAAVKNTGRGAVPFAKFLETFWDYDKSEYIRDQLAHGYRLSRGYAKKRTAEKITEKRC